MTSWNFAPYRDKVRTLRKMRWIVAMLLSAVSGGLAAAWVVNEVQTEVAQQQAKVLDLKTQLSVLLQKNLQMQNDQSQRQKAQDSFLKVEALRQRGQNLLALNKSLALRWPEGVQIQELRLEGPSWRLQGQAESGLAVQQVLNELVGVLPWQQPPALMALETLPQVSGQRPVLRYVAQALWPWPELSPKFEAALPSAKPVSE